jgi:4-amino-4-deoxy-L-arabinose transferase-like glycosyltransferase
VLASRLKQAGLVVAVAALVMLTNLGGPRLWDRDEPRNAGCALEMLHRGDWVVPVFNAELRTHKPVLLYWCIMASYAALGVSELAARLPSALCAIGSCVCVYMMGRRLFGPRAGMWAGIALATSLMFVVAGRAATPDSLLIFCSTLAVTIYVCGTFGPRFETTPLDAVPQLYSSPHAPREGHITRSVMATMGHYFPQHWPTVALMYAAMGLGVLAKGPVGLVLPTAVIGMYLLIVRLPAQPQEGSAWWARDLVGRIFAPLEPLHFLATCWTMRPFTAIFAAAAIAVPWYWAVGLATEGEFLRGFLFEHNLSRATGVMEGHRGSVFFYPLAILVGFFPWSVFAIPLAIDTALQVRRNDRFHPAYLFCLCWLGVYVVIFSLARTKLPSYVTPCYPALALLVGDYVDRWSRQSAAVAGRWLPAAFGCLALAGIGIAIAVPMAAKHYLPGEEWLGLLGLTPVAGGIACMGLAFVRNYRAAAGVFGAAAVAFATLLFAVGAERADRHQLNHLLFQAIHARSPRPQIAAYKILEPSWVFYGGQPVREFGGATHEAAQSGARQAAAFLTESPHAFLITTQQRRKDLESLLPPDIVVLQRVPYFLKDEELVVLHRSHHHPTLSSHTPLAPTPGNNLR